MTISWEAISAVFVAIGVVGGGIGWLIWNIHKSLNKLANNDTEETTDKSEKAAALQDMLVERYKSLYESERDRCGRAIEELTKQVETLRKEVDFLRNRLSEIQEEAEKIRALNLKLQRDGE